jgi:hypothetical protein
MFRKLYWADKGGNSIQPKIAVMNMDGSQPRTINKRRVEVLLPVNSKILVHLKNIESPEHTVTYPSFS